MIMLVPTLYYCLIKERSDKWDAVGSAGFGIIKVVLILLTKTIAVQVKIAIIKIGEPDLQQLLSKLYLDQSTRRDLVLILIL